MTVCELYAFLNEKIPPSLSCEWDNDGLMCCPDPTKEVQKALVALDITGAVVKMAIEEGYDVIVSHHPMIFSPISCVEPNNHVAKKVIDLCGAGITAMSFHTRLDAVEGGVNDALADALGLINVTPFGNAGEEIGRIGTLKAPITLAAFADLVKAATGAEAVQVSDAGKQVSRVAVLGGSGSDDVIAAKLAGADTYLSGEIKHNWLTDAPDLGINLVAAGHFYTEDPVCKSLCRMIREADSAIEVNAVCSNPVKLM